VQNPHNNDEIRFGITVGNKMARPADRRGLKIELGVPKVKSRSPALISLASRLPIGGISFVIATRLRAISRS